jgi:outer membrane protein TolC
MKTKHFLFAALILAAVTPSIFAQAQQTAFAVQKLTVDQAVQLAMNNNLSLQRSALNTASLRRTQDRSWNSLLPTVSVGAMVSHPTSITGEIMPSMTMSPDGRPQDREVWTPGFSINAGLTLSTSVIENIKKAKADYEAGLLSHEAARQELELQVRKLFYQILLLDANRELATLSFQSAQARYEQTAALVRTGQAPRLDELSARVDMENIRPTVRNASLLYENALDTFKLVLNIPIETIVILDGNISIGTTDNLSITSVSANSNSLETSRLLSSIRSMEAQRNAVRNGAYIPTLRLSWTSTPMYNLQNEYWLDSGSFSVTLGFNIDSFLPWSNARTQIQTLNDNIRSAEIQLTDTMRNRENRINQNIRTIERILESLEATKLNVELAQSTYQMIEDAFRRGAADYQRLRGAGDSLEQSRNRLLQEQYNLVSALLDLEKEMNVPFGTLNESAGRSF